MYLSLYHFLCFSNVIIGRANDWGSFTKQITNGHSVLPNYNENYDIIIHVHINCKIWHIKNKYKNEEGASTTFVIAPTCPPRNALVNNV